MYMEIMEGLHRRMVHPEWPSVNEYPSFLTITLKNILRKLHLHSSFSNESLLSYLYGDL